ncbi:MULTISPECIES: hypothetical protein [unclassified Sphingopyxis]|jgi:hypothetical protein|uniref:hypothetical protein n=1 Tax=unclassified Sphingopyxis TaxID=2614943 RepID=UPI000BA6AD88|nr:MULTISPECIES: hypothetical protein [unclassified Sphingopyxis]PAL24636.1 hypothetical protein CD928_04410 [Sphingopyxis sp. GW247-27LB]
MSRLPTDRRTLLKAGLAAPIALQVDSAAAVSLDLTMFGPGRLFADVQSYAEAGNKQSGGAGDRWTADWTAKRLFSAGFEVDRQTFDVPWFEASHCELTLGDHTIPLVAQPLAVETGEAGLAAPLRLAEIPERLDGAIAVVRLPFRRWSSLVDRAVREPLADALARGANGVILITTGPTGEALLLNVPAGHPVSDKPLALLAPRLAAPVIEAARHGAAAKLALRGRGGIRAAQNIIGRRVRSGRPWLVVSTPRSGWTDCAGERGPGIAMWLALAGWMPRAFPQHSLLFLCNSGHEYENLGASHIADKVGPAPGETAFWFHLGANAAARDYQEMPGRLLPLPSADPYRFLMTSPEFVTCAREIFKGQPGLEMAYPSAEGTAGELSEVIKAGYVRHAGIFGAHRHHHAVTDDLSTVTPDPLAATARGVRDLLSAVVS